MLLSPSLLCWALILAVKGLLGHSMGYSVSFSPGRTVYFLVSAPLRTVYPNGLVQFYRSPFGIGGSLFLLLGLCGLGASDRRIRGALVLFFVCQVPYALLGAPESRYFYVGSLFFYPALVLAATRIPGRASFLIIAAALVALNGFWAVNRALLWKGAFREAQSVKAAIEGRMGTPRDTKVVVNLPDSYGPQDLMWRPFVWRDGLSDFRARIIRVNTPHVPFTWREARIPVMTRDEICGAYSAFDILEVTYASSESWRRFQVVDVQRAQRRSPRIRREDDGREEAATTRIAPWEGSGLAPGGLPFRCVPASTQ